MKLEDVYEAHDLVKRRTDLEKAQEDLQADPVLCFPYNNHTFSVDRDRLWEMLDEEIDSIEVRLREMGVKLPEKKMQEEQGDAPVGIPVGVEGP